jgi:predicted kinase
VHQKPKLVIVTGRPGSGKTTLAKELSKLLHLPVVVRDEIKEGYVNTFKVKHEELPEGASKTVTEIFFKTINFLLSQKISLVVEAAFQHKIWEPEINRLKNSASISLVICDVAAELAAKRHLQRGLADPKREFFHGDNRVSHYKKTGELLPAGDYSPPIFEDIPTIKVSTEDGYDPNLEIIAEKVRT